MWNPYVKEHGLSCPAYNLRWEGNILVPLASLISMNSATVYVLGPHSAIKLNSDGTFKLHVTCALSDHIPEEVLIPRPGLQVRPGTHVLGPEADRAIVRVVNTVWDVGMLTILTSLAKLVTVSRTISLLRNRACSSPSVAAPVNDICHVPHCSSC